VGQGHFYVYSDGVMDGEMATKRLVKLREENKARMEGIDRDWVDEMSREIDSADRLG